MFQKCKVGARHLTTKSGAIKLVSSVSARRHLKPLKFIVSKGLRQDRRSAELKRGFAASCRSASERSTFHARACSDFTLSAFRVDDVNGPQRTLTSWFDAALQLHQSSHWLIVQHLYWGNDWVADFAAFRCTYIIAAFESATFAERI